MFEGEVKADNCHLPVTGKNELNINDLVIALNFFSLDIEFFSMQEHLFFAFYLLFLKKSF